MAKVLLIILFVGVVSGSHWDVGEKHHAPQPYKFGYEVKDKEGSQHRHESGDGHGNVKGSYGYTDHKGLYREVHYIADKNGFRAVVKTNEPGTANQDPAAVEMKADPPHHHEYHHGHHHSHVPHHHVHIPSNYNNHHDHHYNQHHHIPFIGYQSNYFAPLHGFSYNPSRFHDYGYWPFMDNKYSHDSYHHHNHHQNHHNYHHHQKSHHHHQPNYIHQYSSLHDHKDHSFSTPKFQHLHGFSGFDGLDSKLKGYSKFGKESVDDFIGKVKGFNSFNHEDGFDGLNIDTDLKDGHVKSWRYGSGNF